MGFLDKAVEAARRGIDKHGDKVAGATAKAGDFVDKRTGGKHTDKINLARRKVNDALDSLDRKNDDIR